MADDNRTTVGGAAPPTRLRLILTVFLPFGCGYYLSYLFRAVNAIISENLTTELAIGPADLGLLTSIYLIAFASSQVPLGVALDRYGPRKINACLLLVAAVGAALFAFAENFALLLAGRALIGFGVSAALMGAFKANALWFPADRIPLMNNLTGAFGAVGAVSATRPVELILHTAGWRDIFAGLAVVTVLVSLAILLLVPERKDAAAIPRQESFARQMSGFAEVIRKAFFWRICLLYVVSYTAFVSYQTLWADPWLRDVAGLAQTERANHLFVMQLGFLAGLLLTGVVTDWLRRTRVQAVHVFGAGMLLLIGLQVLLALGVTVALTAIWGLFGLVSAATYLGYAVLTAHYPAALTGRAITAMNFLLFVFAFVCQWGIGGVIEAFPVRPDGGYSVAAHSTALWVMIGMQVVCYLNFVAPRRARRRRG